MSTNNAPTQSAETPDPVADLRAAAADLDAAEERVAEFGEAELEQLASAYEDFSELLVNYEDRVTGDGDFQVFIEFQGKVAEQVEKLPEDLLLREAFEEADDHLQQRRLSESDFEYVRGELEPVADLVARLDERSEAADRYEGARKRVRKRIQTVDERIAELADLQRLGDADLDAPIEVLQTPIDTYNEAVTEAFQALRRDAPARELLAFLESTAAFPLVPFEAPPPELASYVREHEVGSEPVPKLLEYADYSRSKLGHYVDDPDRLIRVIGGRQSYLQRLDADPLTVDWPPPSADQLRYRCDELTAVVNRLDSAVVEELRAVAALPRRADYDRLRTSAVAKAELAEPERERLRSGAVESELAELRAEREQLTATLDAHPRR